MVGVSSEERDMTNATYDSYPSDVLYYCKVEEYQEDFVFTRSGPADGTVEILLACETHPLDARCPPSVILTREDAITFALEILRRTTEQNSYDA
jgi:hypothetical protein